MASDHNNDVITNEYEWASQVALVVKNPPASAGDKRHEFDQWVGKSPWNRKWHPTAVSLPGKFHGAYSPQGHNELDMTEQLSVSAHACTHTHTHTHRANVKGALIIARHCSKCFTYTVFSNLHNYS